MKPGATVRTSPTRPYQADRMSRLVGPRRDKDRFEVAPFSVLVDVKQVRTLERLRKSLQNAEPSRFPDNVMYIYEKQLEEADVIVLNKADLVSRDELADVVATLKREFSQAPLLTLSALDGDGVDAWLDHILNIAAAGRTIAAVDYDQYAEGEAALGWLNAEIRLHADSGIDWRGFCLGILKATQKKLRELPAEMAHLKLHLTAGGSTLVANLTSNDGEPYLRGVVAGAPREAVLLINVRAEIDPSQLRAITASCIAEVAGKEVRTTTDDLQSFAPSRPAPTHRFSHVV